MTDEHTPQYVPIALQDAMSVILGVQISQRSIPSILEKSIRSFAKPGQITYEHQDALTTYPERKIIGDHVTVKNDYAKAKQRFSELLDQQHEGMTAAILEFGREHGIVQSESEIETLTDKSVAIKRTQYKTTLTDGANVIEALDGRDIVMGNSPYLSKLSSDISEFARKHSYPGMVGVDVAPQNMSAIERKLPPAEIRFAPLLQVEKLGDIKDEIERIDPVKRALFQPNPTYVADVEEDKAAASFASRFSG